MEPNCEEFFEEEESGRARSLKNLKPFQKGYDSRRELARAAKRPAMRIGDLLKQDLNRRIPKSLVKELFSAKEWKVMEPLLKSMPRIGDVISLRLAVGSMKGDSRMMDMLINRTDGKVTQPVAGLFGSVIKVVLPPEAKKGPPPANLDVLYRPGQTKMLEEPEDFD